MVVTTAVSMQAVDHLDVTDAASRDVDQLLAALATTSDGLTTQEAERRLASLGPNAVRTHHTSPLAVLLRQIRSPLLGLLAVTALASAFLGEGTDAVIIFVILSVSVGLGFVNENRAERAAEALHERIRHLTAVRRDGDVTSQDVTQLVPGDVIQLQLGQVVPADVRLIETTALECDESVLTGEAVPVEKSAEPVAPGSQLAELSDCALMGTVVRRGSAVGVVVSTAGHTEFGRLALQLGERQVETEFQLGLRRFSLLLVRVAAVLTTSIFVINLVLHRPILDALLFSLAIAVGITPQLLPAVVSTSLAAGTHSLARRKVLVKRLVCIEDLGDIDVLYTDKTGTLTEGRISFMRAIKPDGSPGEEALQLGLTATEQVAADGTVGNPLDVALVTSPAATPYAGWVASSRRLATLPFDHERRMSSVIVTTPAETVLLVVKGAPESVLARCVDVPTGADAVLQREFESGGRVVAVATRPTAPAAQLSPDDEHDLRLCGFLVFLDRPKASAREALTRLHSLGVRVKVITGDNAVVAAKVCSDLGLPSSHVVTGADLDTTADADLPALVAQTDVFARVSPEHKARIVRAQRTTGVDVAFLGDGVNDAVALHAADVGISVESATDVAKDAADVVLLEQDLAVLADGVVEGRRIFANTMKYVLMGTSSNFGNMFSAAGASLFLTFLPMLPSQILLNNLLYDASQLAIPGDRVDAEQVRRPTRWDIGLIRRFMLVFGPISSAFDFTTFALLLWVFHAAAPEFRTAWFVESLATQTLVVFVIRTRRVPFFRSRPSLGLVLAVLGVLTIAVVLPMTPFAGDLGFVALPGRFYLVLALLVAAYLLLVELGKRLLERAPARPEAERTRVEHHRLHRRASRFTTGTPRERRIQRVHTASGHSGTA